MVLLFYRVQCLFLEEFYLFADDFAKAQIGKAAGSQAEKFVCEPFLAQELFYYCIIYKCIVYGVNASCGLKTNFTAGFLEVLLDGAAHNVCSLGCCGGRLLTG